MSLERSGSRESKNAEQEINLNQGSKIIDLDNPPIGSHEVEINYMDEKVVSDYTKQQTKEFKQEEKKSSNKTLDDAKKTIDQIERTSEFTYSDYEDIAEFIIEMFDTGMSTMLRFWCDDTSYNAYSIPKEKIKMLKKQLTLILIKYQQKFKIEFMFLLSLILVYSGPVKKAYDRRKMLKKEGILGKTQEVIKEQVKEEKKSWYERKKQKEREDEESRNMKKEPELEIKDLHEEIQSVDSIEVPEKGFVQKLPTKINKGIIRRKTGSVNKG